ncbi:MAG TPA: exo-alpha-sialidase, partial [Clostridia bacterium]|nr:exo-alpha-sialidase [Clostridia bacterium]
PCSPMKIARRPETNELYSVWNPIPNYNGRPLNKASWGRTPLVFAASRDEGVTWSECRIIEDDPECGYCYPSVFFTADNAMVVAYCSGGPQDGGCLAKLSMMKIPLEA